MVGGNLRHDHVLITKMSYVTKENNLGAGEKISGVFRVRF